MGQERPTLRRCAIYTRKSTEYGLEQEFNSLHAQREAAEAFIKSQAHEGWRGLHTSYDDGGLSGGTLDRPALQRLLDDVRCGLIDIVVVYKVDRLTRSLTDFAKLVDLFDGHGVSFVSVTQQFNTTNSMGRLTLNVLLSFAQFEREVTGERIRDKIAASKRKGMRMGGPVPLGYEVRAKKLVVNEEEAERVRLIFARYLELGSLDFLLRHLRQKGILTKVSRRKDGTTRGGIAFGKGSLAYLLKNRVYLGEVIHKGRHFAGEHDAIVPPELFEAVAQKLAAGTRAKKRPRTASGALLMGRIYDDRGNRMTPAHATKGGLRYRYYVSSAATGGEGAGSRRRVPASELEQAVTAQLRHLDRLTAWEEPSGEGEGEPTPVGVLVERWLERVLVGRDTIEIRLAPSQAGQCAEPTPPIILPWRASRTRTRREILVPPGAGPNGLKPMRADTRQTLVAALAKARLWWRELASGAVPDTAAIAAREGTTERHVRMALPLAFLAPDIVRAALDGHLPEGHGVSKLLACAHLGWNEQREMVGVWP